MTIVDFLVDLAVDPQALARFRFDPEAAMAEAGLPEAEREAVIEGRPWPWVVHPPLFKGYGINLPHGEDEGSVLPLTGKPLDKRGLTIVGLGIRALQTSAEARVCIAQASKVLYLVADPVSERFVLQLNSNAESLADFYQPQKPRLQIYDEIVLKILACLEQTADLCVVFYGHPGVLSYPTRKALRIACEKGFGARMLPATSALDNLIADLGIDPSGLQSFEATAFLIFKYPFATSAGLVLWQIDVLGETVWDPSHAAVRGRLKLLADYLADFYGPVHEVYLYRAAVLPAARREIECLSLSDLPRAKQIDGTTMYVPPKGLPEPDLDMARKLGVDIRSANA